MPNQVSPPSPIQFKQYNDMYLHLEGNEVLKEAAKVISQAIGKDMEGEARFRMQTPF